MKLEGGFVNSVTQITAGQVQKEYLFNPRNSIDPERRFRREKAALSKFGGVIAPQLLDHSYLTIYQQFIDGETATVLAERKDPHIFTQAGELLRKVHTPVKRSAAQLRNKLEKSINGATERARPILEIAKLPAHAPEINWDEVNKLGTTRLHGDFWFNNILRNGGDPVAVDWEWSGIGSPYEDFTSVKGSVFTRWPDRESEFWQGYGTQPDPDTLNNFMKVKILNRFGRLTPAQFEKDMPDQLYHRLAHLYQSL